MTAIDGPDAADNATAPSFAPSTPEAPHAAALGPAGALRWSGRQRLAGAAVASIGFIVVAVTLVRAGVALHRLDLAASWQLIELRELTAHPLGSVWYLHTQPPLHNLVIGSVMRWSPFPPVGTLFAMYLGALWATAMLLTDLLAKWRVHPVFAGAVTAVALANPNLLSTIAVASYEVPVTLLVVASVWWFQRYLQQPGAGSLVGLGVTLTALALTRSLFHPVFVLAVIGLAVLARRRPWRQVTLVMAIPIVLVGGWMLKNQVLFGTPTTSSWLGFNLSRGVLAPMDRGSVQDAVDDGAVTSLALEYPWATLDRYQPWLGSCTPDHDHPAVTVRNRRDVGPVVIANWNNECYLPLYQESQANALTMIRREPGQYLRSRVTVLGSSFAITAIGSDGPTFAVPGRAAPHRTWLDDVGDTVLAPVDVTIPMGRWNLPLLGTDLQYRASLTLALLAAGVGARSVLAAVRLTRAGWRDRAETWSTDELVWLMVGVTGTVIILVGDLLEFGENGRFRSMVDPLLVALPLAALARIVANRWPRPRRAEA